MADAMLADQALKTEVDHELLSAAYLILGRRQGPFATAVADFIDSAIQTELNRSLPGAAPRSHIHPGYHLDPASDPELGFAEGGALGLFLKTLVEAPIVVMHLNGDYAAYLFGVREALSHGITIACVDSGTPSWPDAVPPRRFVNLSAPDAADEIARALGGAGDRREGAWPSAIRRSRAVNVSVSSPPLKSSFARAEGQLEDTPLSTIPLWSIPVQDGATTFLAAPRIGIVEGSIDEVSQIDVWVNSENTLMQMARIWEKSVSARIRRLGSRPEGRTLGSARYNDALALALAQAMGARRELKIGEVIITPAPPGTQLARTTRPYRGMRIPGSGVKLVAHVAAVRPRGDGGAGFESGGDIPGCVENVLTSVASFADREFSDRDMVRSILFPMLGAGDGGAPVYLVASQLVANVVKWAQLHTPTDDDFPQAIYLLAFRASDAAACRAALEASGCKQP